MEEWQVQLDEGLWVQNSTLLSKNVSASYVNLDPISSALVLVSNSKLFILIQASQT